VGIDLGCEPAPDETTVVQVPALVGRTPSGGTDSGEGEPAPASPGVRITTGTIVDATILHAPTSTKNQQQQRDPEMHQDEEGEVMVLRNEGTRGGR